MMQKSLVSAIIGSMMVAACVAVDSCPNTNVPGTYTNVALLKTNNTRADDHFYIGGLFGVHDMAANDAYVCSDMIRNRGIVNLEAFFWSINKFKSVLPRVDVGGVAFDSCGRKEQTITNVLSFARCTLRPDGVDRRQLLGYVGPDRSSEALAISSVMKDLNLTYISHAATSPELSDSTEHPFFLRTTPSDSHDAVIMASVLNNLNVPYALVVYLDNDYGRAGMMQLSEELKKFGVCAEKKIPIPVNPDEAELTEIVNMLTTYASVKYVTLFADAEHSRKVLDAVSSESSIAGKLIFFGTSSLGKNTDLINNLGSVIENSFVTSQVVVEPYAGYLEEFKTYWKNLKPDKLPSNYQNQWLRSYWEQKFNCRFDIGPRLCNTSANSFSDADIDVYTPNVIMAVEAIIKGIKNVIDDKCENLNLCSSFVNLRNQGTIIYETIKELQSGNKKIFNVEKSADDKYKSGDVSKEFSYYEVYNIKDDKYETVYNYKPDSDQRILQNVKVADKSIYSPGTCPSEICPVCNPITTPPPVVTTTTTKPTVAGTTAASGMRRAAVSYPWNQEITGAFDDSFRNQTEYMTRFEIGQRWIIPIGVLAGLGIFAVIVFEIYVMYKLLGSHNSHKWRTVWLGQLLLFGIFLSYLTLFAYIPIPTKATCGITRFGVGISYAIMFAVLLVKLMVILTSKTSESLLPGDVESPNYLKGIYQFLMFMFAVAVQAVIGIQWLITVPPQAIKVRVNNGQYYWICNHYTWLAGSGWMDMSSFVRSEFENHLLSLIYIMVLILITTILALKSHGIITNNRESVFIGISAGFSIPIWLAWTLVGGLNGDHDYAHEFGDACIAFGLFLTATLIMFAMFLPKVRQLVNMGVEGIYFEDDRDTVYNESIILPPPSYKSRPGTGSVIYVNNADMYADPVIVGNGTTGNHLRYSTAGSMYSSPPGMYRKAESTIGPSSKILRVTGDLTGRRRPQSQSDIGIGRRSDKGTLTRSRSHQNIGAL